MKTRTIRVQGKGSASQAPDRISIRFDVAHKDREFEKAIEGCNSRVESIRSAATEMGLDSLSLKTSDFGVQEEDVYSEGVRKHIGFIAKHSLTIDLPVDHQKVARFLDSVVHAGADPEIRLTFTVSNEDNLMARVLANAVANAKTSAEIIATSAGVKLGQIVEMQHGYSENFMPNESFNMRFGICCAHETVPSLNPEDVQAHDTVTIVWEIVE